MVIRVIKSVFVILLLSATSAYGQSASETVREYFGALQEQDYERAATFFEQAALHEFRDMMNFIVELPEEVQGDVFPSFFGPSATPETVAKLSDSDFFGAFLKAVMAQANAVGGVNFDGQEILGEVAEGQDVLHVVTRNKVSVGEIEVEAMEVISLKTTDAGWKLLLSGKMKGIASQIRAALSQAASQGG